MIPQLPIEIVLEIAAYCDPSDLLLSDYATTSSVREAQKSPLDYSRVSKAWHHAFKPLRRRIIWDNGSHEHRLNVLDQCLSNSDAAQDVRAISTMHGTQDHSKTLMRSGSVLNAAQRISSDPEWLQIFRRHDAEQGITNSRTIAEYSTAIMALITALLPRVHTIYLRPRVPDWRYQLL